MDYQKAVAKSLLTIGAVGFAPQNPITFKSGIKSPVYVDNRKFPFHPSEWKTVIQGFKDLIKEKGLELDVIAGVEAAGIPHSAALGFFMDKPSVFVRKKAKDHGTKSMVEGGKVEGLRVILIEDLVTTGGSSLASIESLRKEGAVISDCLIIVSYGFRQAKEAFAKANVNLHTLTTFPIILEEALAMGKFSKEEKEIIEDWLTEPHGWAKRQGLE